MHSMKPEPRILELPAKRAKSTLTATQNNLELTGTPAMLERLSGDKPLADAMTQTNLELADRATGTEPTFIGVDPGISGALVVLTLTRVHAIYDMPVKAKTAGKGNEVNGYEVARVVRGWLDEFWPEHAYVENVGARPGEGVVSMFSFGKNTGVVIGVLQAFGMPLTTVAPGSWKARAGLRGQPKSASRGKATMLYPHASEELTSIGKGTARADAILIGHYGYQMRR